MAKPPTSDAAGAVLAEAVLRKAMARAFVLGQDWWAQADSESFRQNKKADITRAVFDALVNETVAALSTPQPPPEAGSVGDEIAALVTKLAKAQKPLDPDVTKILREHWDELFDDAAPAPKESHEQ